MRRIVLALLCLFALAAPAAAQPKRTKIVIPPPAANTAPAKPTPPIKPTVAAPSIARFATAAKPDPAACSQSCARNYYFCQAGGTEDCGAAWAKCRAGCTQGTSSILASPLPR
jgi:hypothetical protein